MNKPAQQRALAGKQRKIKNVKMTYIRNDVIRVLAVVLPVILFVVMLLDQLGSNAAYQIKRVEYQGAFKFVGKGVIDQIAVESIEGNFFTADLVKLKHDIEQVNWVKTARIDKKWPSKIVIAIDEHRPIAAWGNSGWVSEGGQLIVEQGNLNVNQVEGLNKLPKLQGKLTNLKIMTAKFSAWQQLLAESELSIEKLFLSDANSWQLALQSKDAESFELKLGAVGNIDTKLLRFTNMFEQNRAQFFNVKYVDARYPDGVAIKYKSNSGESTSPQLSKKIKKEGVRIVNIYSQLHVFGQPLKRV